MSITPPSLAPATDTTRSAASAEEVGHKAQRERAAQAGQRGRYPATHVVRRGGDAGADPRAARHEGEREAPPGAAHLRLQTLDPAEVHLELRPGTRARHALQRLDEPRHPHLQLLSLVEQLLRVHPRADLVPELPHQE